MLYAEVIVRQRTGAKTLSYAVPASMLPYLKIGSLVKVPLRKQTVDAVVIGLKKHIPALLRTKVRLIDDIQRERSLPAERLKLITQLAAYYGSSTATVAFHALSDLDVPDLFSTSSPKAPVFIQGSFQERMKFYVELWKKEKNRSWLFIFARSSQAEAFSRVLPGEVVLDTGQAVARHKISAAYRDQKPITIISSLHRVFLPLPANSTLVVDQPDNIALKYQQRPFMRAKTIAEFRARLEGVRVILGGNLPHPTDVPKLLSNRWRLKKVASAPPQPLTIFNRLGVRELFSPGLTQEISLLLNKSKRLLFLVLARGWASALICRACGHVSVCSRCGRTAGLKDSELHCHYCGAVTALPANCPNCSSTDLRPVGEGVSRVTDELTRRYPQVRVQEVSSDQPALHASSQVVVATEKVLSLDTGNFDAVIFFSVDRLITGTSVDGTWQLANYLNEFGSLSKQVLIQTYLPDHPVWGFVGKASWREYFQYELKLRRRSLLPPFATLFALRTQARNLNLLQRDAKSVAENLLRHLGTAHVGTLEVERRGVSFRGLIPILNPGTISASTKEVLRDSLPPAWHLDIEPEL